MRINKMRKLPRLIIDTMLLTLLLAMLAMPISSIGLLNPQVTQQNSQVLSTQDARPGSAVQGNEAIIESPVPYPIEYYLQGLESNETSASASADER